MCKVSVAVPVYNAESYVEEMIESFLRQTMQDFEIICVDDASTDRSYEKIKNFHDNRIKVYRNDVNKGIAYTRNMAVEFSSGEYVAFMDDDDIAPLYRLEREVEFLDDNREIDLVGGASYEIDMEGKIIRNKRFNPLINPAYIKAFLMLGNAYASGSVMVRRDFLVKNHLKFKDKQYGAEDYRFWMECSLVGKLANINDVLLYWRNGHDHETARILERHYEERRAAISKIHDDALRGNGFELEADELELLNLVFAEEGVLGCREDMERLYQILQKIANQSVQLGLENSKEIITMCRKRFGEKIGKAFFLWV